MKLPEKYSDHMSQALNEKIYYILDENKNVIPSTLIEWANYLEENKQERIVKQDKINDFDISTVFFGLDHKCLKDSHPAIFETMIFEGGDMKGIYCSCYSTYQEAEEGHQRAIEWINHGCKDREEE